MGKGLSASETGASWVCNILLRVEAEALRRSLVKTL